MAFCETKLKGRREEGFVIFKRVKSLATERMSARKGVATCLDGRTVSKNKTGKRYKFDADVDESRKEQRDTENK